MRIYLIYLKSGLVKELIDALGAVYLFLMPDYAIAKALREGIVTDFGCWFWIDVDGLKVCRRYLLAPATGEGKG